jgi:type I restriction enzyme S subunit
MATQNWPLLPLHKLPIQIVDGDRSAKYPKRDEFQMEGVVFLNSTNIIDNRLSLSECNRIPEEKYEEIRKGRTRHLDIVMTTRGSIGKVALVRQQILNRGLINAQMLLIRADAKTLDPTFLFYVTCSDRFQGELRNFASGSAQPQIPITDLRQVSVPVPPLPTQRKIVAILSAYDDLIENNLRRIKIFEEIAQNLYREWFVKFRFPGHQHARFTDSALGKMPEGWEEVDLLSVADVTYGFAFQSNQFNPDGNGMPVVRIRDVLAGTSDTFSSEEAGKKYLVEIGDILVGMDGEFHMGFWVGGQAYLVQRVALFRSKGEIGRYHLFLALQEPIQHFNATITGTTVAHLGDKHIKTIVIKWPQAQLKNQFNSFLEPMLAQILNLRIKNIILRRTRDLLLPRLISGEVDVSAQDIAIPEEASA